MTDQQDKPKDSAGEATTDADAALESTSQTQSEASEEKPASTPSEPPRRRTGAWLMAPLLLLLMGAVAGLAYFGWEREQQLQTRVDQLEEALSAQRSQVSGVERQTQAVASQAETVARQSRQQIDQLQNQLQSRLSEQRRELEAQLQTLHQQLRSLSTTTTEDWKLAEAYYLMRLAAQRLLMERDTGSALALLETADGIVKSYPDADLHAVRSALAEDITTLRLANNVDLQGIYLRIAALGRQAHSLPIANHLTFDREATEEERGTEAEPEDQDIWSTIRESFRRMLDRLQDYIRISHDEEALNALTLSPAAADQLLSSLLLHLDTAQLALLREQPEIYQHSLERAQQLSLRLFADSQQRQRFVSELEALRDTDILQELPGIGASQQAMAVYLERRHRLAPRSNGQQPQEQQP